MQDFDFKGFMSSFSMTVDSAQRVFGISRRTVIRYRVTGQVPATAVRLARSIERAAPPWSRSFWRGLQYGLSQLPEAWRADLYGKDWKKALSPAELASRQEAADALEYWRQERAAKEAERLEAISRARSKRMLKLHATRRAARAGEPTAADTAAR
ncbi:hypothetical protein [Nevskia ramosa]|uniref:hypothetical protein n=1 Tax=Nevskia ramosa TaxID=64002 RepID=UPI0003B40E17|nr:hypothetical protein [Nevskia ramosa]